MLEGKYSAVIQGQLDVWLLIAIEKKEKGRFVLMECFWGGGGC